MSLFSHFEADTLIKINKNDFGQILANHDDISCSNKNKYFSVFTKPVFLAKKSKTNNKWKAKYQIKIFDWKTEISEKTHLKKNIENNINRNNYLSNMNHLLNIN